MKQQNPTSQLVSFDDLPDSSFIRLNQLVSNAVIPFSAATAWRRVRDRTFPQPVRISPQVTAWRVGEVRQWMKCPSKFISSNAESKQIESERTMQEPDEGVTS